MPIFQLSEDLIFPHPELAEEGWLAIGGDLRPERLLLAYSNGIFPWPESEEAPIYWASPDPRTILYLEKYKTSKRLQRIIRQKKFSVTFDSHFDNVIKQCAASPRPGQSGTWITSSMQIAYKRLFEMGFVHSIETHLDGELVGGIYGLSLGGAFFGESMFYLVNDASKVAFYYLVHRLRQWNFRFIDAQVATPHLMEWGAEEISRSTYLDLLHETLTTKTKRGSWRLPEEMNE